jgi:hypothetical protein
VCAPFNWEVNNSGPGFCEHSTKRFVKPTVTDPTTPRCDRNQSGQQALNDNARSKFDISICAPTMVNSHAYELIKRPVCKVLLAALTETGSDGQVTKCVWGIPRETPPDASLEISRITL